MLSRVDLVSFNDYRSSFACIGSVDPFCFAPLTNSLDALSLISVLRMAVVVAVEDVWVGKNLDIKLRRF